MCAVNFSIDRQCFLRQAKGDPVFPDVYGNQLPNIHEEGENILQQIKTRSILTYYIRNREVFGSVVQVGWFSQYRGECEVVYERRC